MVVITTDNSVTFQVNFCLLNECTLIRISGLSNARPSFPQLRRTQYKNLYLLNFLTFGKAQA